MPICQKQFILLHKILNNAVLNQFSDSAIRVKVTKTMALYEYLYISFALKIDLVSRAISHPCGLNTWQPHSQKIRSQLKKNKHWLSKFEFTFVIIRKTQYFYHFYNICTEFWKIESGKCTFCFSKISNSRFKRPKNIKHAMTQHRKGK